MKIYERMKTVSAHLLEEINHLSFNKELSVGTLNQDIFYYYLIQDVYYLSEYARALSLTGSRFMNMGH